MKSTHQPLAPVWQWILIGLLLTTIFLVYGQQIDLTTADLGRHLKNGEIFWRQHRLIDTNHYSYTEPKFPTVTHHWGAGVIFYLVWRLADFTGLSLFYILLHLVAFGLLFYEGLRRSDFTATLVAAVLAIPLLASRVEIRPEGFSYLFLAIFIFLLNRYRDGELNWKMLMILPIIEVFWVNLHIYFIFGPAIAGAFFIGSLINRERLERRKVYLVLSTVLSLATLVNPWGIKGALVPFTIFREYGYMIVENQSVLFMQRRFFRPVYLHFEVLFFLVTTAFVLSKRSLRANAAEVLITIFFGLLSWRAIRGFPLFGLILIPVGAGYLFRLVDKIGRSDQDIVRPVLIWSSALILVFGILVPGHYYSPRQRRIGLGLLPGVNLSAQFFKDNLLKGPIFNNYDIGGYLIYHLFPKERVFTDNRPEAYSESFFKDTYIPMQEDEKEWQRVDNRFNFNVIYFYRHDLTPWAQPFLIRRIQDPKWAPVFVDNYTLILLKRNEQNRDLIKKFELPQDIFSQS